MPFPSITSYQGGFMQNHLEKPSLWMLGLVLLVGVGGILYGYDIGVVSGALLFMNQSIPMSDTELGIIVGAVLGGSLVGTLAAGPLADLLGRRWMIVLASVIFIVGVSCILIAHSFIAVLLARLCLGVGVGIVSVAVPLYITEIVPAKDRGKYVTFFQLFLTLGIVLAYGVDLVFTPSGNWRAMFAVVLIPATILLLGIFRLPETPRWLLAKQREEEAYAVLSRTQAAEEVESIAEEIRRNLRETKASWTELFSKRQARPLWIAIGIAVFNQMTGINCFLQYAPSLLKTAGLGSNMTVMLGSGGIGLINFLCTAVAIFFVDRIGRRPILITGIVGVVLSEVFLAMVSHINLPSQVVGLASLLGLFAFILFYAIGPGVVVWLAISELFPTKLRGKGIALCLFFNSLVGTFLSGAFLNIIHKVGISGAYGLCAICSVLYLLLTCFYLPETKNKSLEQIQQDFQDLREISLAESLVAIEE